MKKPDNPKIEDQREEKAYAAVSFLYALGQGLYDIYSSQQARQTSSRFGNGFLAAYAYAMLVSAYPFAKAISSPYVGYLSDKLGRRRVLVATLAATAFCLRLCGTARSYQSVLFARLLTGCVANGGLLTARATDVAADHAQRTRLFSLFTTAWALARVAAALIVRLFRSIDLENACMLASCSELAAAAIACLSFGVPPPKQKEMTTDKKNDDKQIPVLPQKKPSFRALAREMLSERLALCLFATSMLTPRVDATAFVSTKFSEVSLAEAVGYLKAMEAVAVVLVSLTPASKLLTKSFGDAGAAIVAACLVAFSWLAVAAAPTMSLLYIVVFARAAFAAVYDPAARSLVWARAANQEKKVNTRVGSLVGLQQSLKGATQVFSSWLGAYLTNVAVSSPLLISAFMMIANAFSIAYLDKATPISPKAASPSEGHHFVEATKLTSSKSDDIVVAIATEKPSSSRSCPYLQSTLEKVVTLISRCETGRTSDAWSVSDVASWLRARGQHAAAKLALANGVDGTALSIATSADELRDAFDGALSPLVCRAILRAFKTAKKPDDDEGLCKAGKSQALELRNSLTGYDLVVVSPDRASIQTALIALSSTSRFIAHDAAALVTNLDLQCEYGAAVDFTFVDDDRTDYHRKVFALVAFLDARPEKRIAVVADGLVLDALATHYGDPAPKMVTGDHRDLRIPSFVSHDDDCIIEDDDDEPESF